MWWWQYTFRVLVRSLGGGLATVVTSIRTEDRFSDKRQIVCLLKRIPKTVRGPPTVTSIYGGQYSRPSIAGVTELYLHPPMRHVSWLLAATDHFTCYQFSLYAFRVGTSFYCRFRLIVLKNLIFNIIP